MSQHYFASDGNYGDADLIALIDTTRWTAADWARIESASDSDRFAVAKRIDEGIEVFRVTYHVSMIHEVFIEARDQYAARDRFEYLYENHQGEMPEYDDITHSIEDVEVAETLSPYDDVFTIDHE
jgi:hypothetical protein